MSTFKGFSEEDLARIKSGSTKTSSVTVNGQVRKINLPSVRKKLSPTVKQLSDDSIDDIQFDKCRLSIKSPTSNDADTPEDTPEEEVPSTVPPNALEHSDDQHSTHNIEKATLDSEMNNNGVEMKTDTMDIVRGVDYSEVELSVHKAKLEELQLKQRLMEEQNKKRKEMLAKALADRTRQTEEEVQKLEKIKKELQVLDGQFSQDVAVLRKKIDQACLSYAEAEKHYLKVEKEFLQAKIQLQKEKEKKELLTEHLCALITHNETRKAQKLETLMLELATNKKIDDSELNGDSLKVESTVNESINNEEPFIIDGVDQRTDALDPVFLELLEEGKIVYSWCGNSEKFTCNTRRYFPHSPWRQPGWWSDNLTHLREASIAARRKYTRFRRRRQRTQDSNTQEAQLYDAYRTANQALNEEIAKAKEQAKAAIRDLPFRVII